jgi:hypothetical protein
MGDHAQRNASGSRKRSRSTLLQNWKEKVMEMLLYLANKIHELGGDDRSFFVSAYIWRFNKVVDISGDVLAYRVQGFVPPYVSEYIKHIQQSG